jgi:hypothetical protein
MAPVNAPFSCPNSSLSSSPVGIAAQLSFTKVRSLRRLRSWMARAINSLPVPVSPRRRTVESLGATVSTRFKTWRRADSVPQFLRSPSRHGLHLYAADIPQAAPFVALLAGFGRNSTADDMDSQLLYPINQGRPFHPESRRGTVGSSDDPVGFSNCP